jgi:hypothetical protein
MKGNERLSPLLTLPGAQRTHAPRLPPPLQQPLPTTAAAAVVIVLHHRDILAVATTAAVVVVMMGEVPPRWEPPIPTQACPEKQEAAEVAEEEEAVGVGVGEGGQQQEPSEAPPPLGVTQGSGCC